MLRIFGYLILSHSIHSFPMKMIFVLLWFLFTCRPRFTICAVITLILCRWLMSMLLTSGSLEKWNLCKSDKCLDDLIWNSFNRNCLIIIGICTKLTLTDTGHWIIRLTVIQSNSSEFVTYNNLPFSPGAFLEGQVLLIASNKNTLMNLSACLQLTTVCKVGWGRATSVKSSKTNNGYILKE